MSWQKVRVGDFLIRVKDLVPIVDNHEYNLVTIKLYHKGVQLRKVVKGSEIQADKMSKVKAGQFILSGIDARNGAFGIIPRELDGAVVTNDFWHFEINTRIISNDYFLWLTSTPYFDDICNRASDGTTNRIRLQADRFYNQELIIPELQDQQKVVVELKSTNSKIKELEVEYQFQLTELKNLNKAILQEAIQGKLVAQNPKDEPGSKLLKQIKEEKAQGDNKRGALIAYKHEDIPFEIPKNWVWCRLGDICSKIGSGSTPKGGNYSNTGFPFFRSQNIYNEGLNYGDIKFISEDIQKQMNGTAVFPNDVLLNITGGSMGRCALVPIDFEVGNVSQHVCIIRPLMVDRNFFHKIVISPYFQKLIFSSTTGAGREGLPKYNLERFLIPLPPLSEQKRILAEIECQLAITKKMEEQIITSQQSTEQLLKALLNQAFEIQEISGVDKNKRGNRHVSKKQDEENWQRQLIALYVQTLTEQRDDMRQGEMGLAKYIYLNDKIGGASSGFQYLAHNFGPYALEMKACLRTMGDILVKKQVGVKKFEVYDLGNDAIDFMDKESPILKTVKREFEKLADAFRPFPKKERARQLELVASVCWLIEELKTLNLSNLYEGMKNWKTPKREKENKAGIFTKQEVAEAIQFIKHKQWHLKLLV